MGSVRHYLGWAVVVIGLLSLTLIVLLNPQRPVPAGELSQRLYEDRPFEVELELFEIKDTSRPTSANGRYTGSPERELKGKLWRPYIKRGTQAGPFPLLVYSHGYMSFHQEGTYLAEFMASHGYIVVAVDFPLSNYFAPGGPVLSDVANQPGDVSFIISEVLSRNTQAGDSLMGLVDEQRIGVVGLSLGGMTTELVTFHPTLRDERIKAAVSIAGPSRMFTETFFRGVTVPFMMVAGEQDAIVPYIQNALAIREKDPDSVLVTIKAGSHAGFAGISAILFRWANNPDAFGCSSMKGKVERNDRAFAGLIDEKAGVIKSERTGYCEDYKNLPRAIRPARQQMFTTLAVFSFFESIFSRDKQQQLAMTNYLLQTLSVENTEVKVDAGDYRAAIHP